MAEKKQADKKGKGGQTPKTPLPPSASKTPAPPSASQRPPPVSQRPPPVSKRMPPASQRLRTGYSVPKPDVIPGPTWSPAAMAVGITFMGWGLITSPIVFGIGAVVFAVSLTTWIGDIRHERKN